MSHHAYTNYSDIGCRFVREIHESCRSLMYNVVVTMPYASLALERFVSYVVTKRRDG